MLFEHDIQLRPDGWRKFQDDVQHLLPGRRPARTGRAMDEGAEPMLRQEHLEMSGRT